MGTETDGAADGDAQPLPLGMVKSKSPEARASSSASTTTAARGRHGHSGSKADRERRSGLRPGPFGLSDGRSGTITGSGVMVDLAPVGQPIDQATDPRWVLAVRTAEALQGSILPPDKREQLLRLGKVMGMTAFDANLVIAIVQDQARRGYAPEYCPTAGELQLQMVPKPGSGGKLRQFVPGRGALKVACVIAAVLAAEIIFVHWWLG